MSKSWGGELLIPNFFSNSSTRISNLSFSRMSFSSRLNTSSTATSPDIFLSSKFFFTISPFPCINQSIDTSGKVAINFASISSVIPVFDSSVPRETPILV